jgi:hypothetical protein
MATYEELHTLLTDPDLIKKVEIAVLESARIVGDAEDGSAPFDQAAGAHDNRVRWAGRTITQTGAEARNIYKLVLMQNKASTVVNIRAATDSAIQSNVNSMVDVVAKALSLA